MTLDSNTSFTPLPLSEAKRKNTKVKCLFPYDVANRELYFHTFNYITDEKSSSLSTQPK